MNYKMSYKHATTKMNTSDVSNLRKEVSDINEKLKTIKENKEESLKKSYTAVDMIPKMIEELEKNINSLKKEIGDRQIHPEWYKVSAGAGTLQHIINNIHQYGNYINELKKQLDYHNTCIRGSEFDEAIEDLENQREDLLHTIANIIGLENLKNERRNIGKMMSKHYRLQKEAYDLQKERYENCKNSFGFTPDDREFIDHHTNLKEQHQSTWEDLRIKREEICELIELLDPNDQDHGFDEFEDV